MSAQRYVCMYAKFFLDFVCCFRAYAGILASQGSLATALRYLEMSGVKVRILQSPKYFVFIFAFFLVFLGRKCAVAR